MEKSMKTEYFSELTICLRQMGFTVLPGEDGVLPVEWNGKPLCQITGSGSIRYPPEDMVNQDTELACGQVTNLASRTAE